MTARALVDGVAADSVPLDDRGFLYGDGLFESMAARDGAIALWPWHWRRLEAGCVRLGIAPPPRAMVEGDIARVTAARGDAVVRVIVTRGSGPRGYAPPRAPVTRRLVLAETMPAIAAGEAGVTVGWSDVPSPHDPALAGLKHLARLREVVARAAFAHEDWADAIVSDANGVVVGATSANVFARVEGHWRTPSLDRGGVAGVCRAALLEAGHAVPPITAGLVSREELRRADAVFLTNAVRGVMPVTRLGNDDLPASIDAAQPFGAFLAAIGHPAGWR